MTEQDPTSGPETEQAGKKARSPAVTKIMDLLEKNFSNIFSETHWPYTVLFFCGALFLAFLQLFQGSQVTLTIGLFVATTLILTYGLLFVLSNIRGLDPHLITSRARKKAIIFASLCGISAGLVVIFFILSKQLPAQYHYNVALPVVFIGVYFGWNFIQIFFIRKGLEDISFKVEKSLFEKDDRLESKNKTSKAILILAIVAPFGMQIAILALLFGGTSETVTNLWNDPLGQVVFMAWFGGTFFLLITASIYIWALHKQTVKHDTPSIFAPFIHMLFYIYILFRGYGFINAVGKAIRGQEIPLVDQVLDILLVVLTLLLLFKGLGSKLSRVSVFNKNNLPFIAYLFATVVIMGIMSMVLGIETGGTTVQIPQSLVSSVNNLMMFGVAIIFYFLYLKRKLSQEDYLERDTFSLHEVQVLLQDYSWKVANEHPQVNREHLQETLAKFMDEREISMKKSWIDVGSPKPEPRVPHVQSPAFPASSPSSMITPPKQENQKRRPDPSKDSKDGKASSKSVISKYPLEQPKKIEDDENDENHVN